MMKRGGEAGGKEEPCADKGPTVGAAHGYSCARARVGRAATFHRSLRKTPAVIGQLRLLDGPFHLDTSEWQLCGSWSWSDLPARQPIATLLQAEVPRSRTLLKIAGTALVTCKTAGSRVHDPDRASARCCCWMAPRFGAIRRSSTRPLIPRQGGVCGTGAPRDHCGPTPRCAGAKQGATAFIGKRVMHCWFP